MERGDEMGRVVGRWLGDGDEVEGENGDGMIASEAVDVVMSRFHLLSFAAWKRLDA